MDQSGKAAPRIAEKWGFGMAPPKPDTQTDRMRDGAVLLDVLARSAMPPGEEPTLSAISTVKGLFNRVVREDQWDWFTVARQLGFPSRRIAEAIAFQLQDLRRAIRDQDQGSFHDAHDTLRRLPTRRCLSVFLGHSVIADEADAGWIYVLSTRELPQLLKVGMTTRTVEARVQEINRATGVAIPFGVRRCWRVVEPARIEKLAHETLLEFRLRGDREFFSAPFVVAAKMLDTAIRESGCEIRTLDALTALA